MYGVFTLPDNETNTNTDRKRLIGFCEGVYTTERQMQHIFPLGSVYLQRDSQSREAANLHGVQGYVPAKGHSLLWGFSEIIPGKP